MRELCRCEKCVPNRHAAENEFKETGVVDERAESAMIERRLVGQVCFGPVVASSADGAL